MGSIKHPAKLLQGIADGLQKHHNTRVHDLLVRFYDDNKDTVLVRDLPTALDYLANDTHWDEEGDWSDAVSASVGPL